MNTLGIIGGLGPESTIEYYRLIFEAYRARVPDGSAPVFLINSVDMKTALRCVEASDFAGLVNFFVAEIQKLGRAGANFGLISANTPHIAFDGIQRRSPIPLISIVVAACDHAKALGLKRLALLGTRFTMQGQFYPDVFSRESIEVVSPTEEEQAFIHGKYMNELVKGIVRPETRQALLGIVDKIQKRDGIEGVILAGTELPLILKDLGDRKLALLDTARIHVDAAVTRMIAEG